eukprot:TRINITY_DN6621_c0_g1_i17.p1 TRINITY_DN6621_c0_g1~~TRINITY_DN6621_c0_g1_i17.p1  ORF type:complete len:146 (+),score=32.93 TRINITY_DN6621_c0_g1_i17:146-583(+)
MLIMCVARLDVSVSGGRWYFECSSSKLDNVGSFKVVTEWKFTFDGVVCGQLPESSFANELPFCSASPLPELTTIGTCLGLEACQVKFYTNGGLVISKPISNELSHWSFNIESGLPLIANGLIHCPPTKFVKLSEQVRQQVDELFF